MKIYHHTEKDTGDHRYYTSLTALCIDLEGELGVSKYTLDRWDWSAPYENELCIIRRGKAMTTTEARKVHPLHDLPPDKGAGNIDLDWKPGTGPK